MRRIKVFDALLTIIGLSMMFGISLSIYLGRFPAWLYLFVLGFSYLYGYADHKRNTWGTQ